MKRKWNRRDFSKFVSLECKVGGTCRIVHPWPSEGVPVCWDVRPEGATQRVKLSEGVAGQDRVFHWVTVASHRYLLVRSVDTLGAWRVGSETPGRRTSPRTLKQATLGRERLF